MNETRSGITEETAETEMTANSETEIPETLETKPESAEPEIPEDAGQEGEETSERKRILPTQAVLTIRAIVGGYLLYLTYQILTSGSEITILMWLALALFIAAGTGLIIMSVKHLICGEYQGGKKDI